MLINMRVINPGGVLSSSPFFGGIAFASYLGGSVAAITDILSLGDNTGSGAPIAIVSGKLKCTTFQMTASPTAGYILTADNAGNGTWSPPPGGSGSVTTVSVVKANGFDGTVADPLTTPAITLKTTVTGIIKGNGTSGIISAASDGTDYLSPSTGVTLSQSTGQTIGATGSRLTKLWATDITCTNAISGSVTGNAGTVTGATFTTALTVNGGTLTLTANAANTSVLTIGAGAVSVSGSNTGDQDLSGYVTKAMYTPAHSFLINNADVTPIALTIAQEQVPGRTRYSPNNWIGLHLEDDLYSVSSLYDTIPYAKAVHDYAVSLGQTTGQTIGDTTHRVTKLWVTDITCTNAISGSVTGNAGTVSNATFTTALTVNGGTLTLTANAANTSVLTIGAGAVSVSGSNTGDQDLSGLVTTSQSTGQTVGTTSNRVTKLWVTDITCTNAISGSVTGNAGTVSNATLTTALTVNGGTLTLTANAANTSVLTIGAGAVSVSGSNTGDQNLSGLVTTSQSTGQTVGTTSNRVTKLWVTDITCTNAISGSVTGNAGTVSNATFTTALTVNGGTLTLTANAANTSVLTIGAGAVSVSGSNTGDQDLSGLVTTAQGTGQTVGTTSNRVTKIWVTDITCTNAISGSVTGNAGTVTGLTFVSGKTLTVNNILTLAGTDSTTMTFPSSSGTVATLAATQTFTNKRITPRTTAFASNTSYAIDTDSYDFLDVTALAAAITFTTSGTPTLGQKLTIQIKDNGTARGLTFDTSYFEPVGVALPTTTVISKRLRVGFIYDTTTSKWGCVASVQEA